MSQKWIYRDALTVIKESGVITLKQFVEEMHKRGFKITPKWAEEWLALCAEVYGLGKWIDGKFYYNGTDRPSSKR